jgi:hypothetical protein
MRFGLISRGFQVQASRLNCALGVFDCRNYLRNNCLRGSNPVTSFTIACLLEPVMGR